MNLISSFLHSRSVVIHAVFMLGMTLPLAAKSKEDKTPMLRFVCTTALAGHDEYILASQKKSGRWKEHQTLQLRSSLITPWIEAPEEELFLCVREDRDLVSKGTITYPKGARRALVILQPGEKDDEYEVQVIDTAKQAFGKGEILLVNFSSMPVNVALGENKVEVKPGESSAHKPSLDDKGMFHMLVTYTDEAGEVVTCDDRYLPANDTGRDFLLLTPDPRMGLSVSSLPDFGPFE